MKSKFLSTVLVTILIIVLVTACASSTETPSEPSATPPTVIDSSGVIAEGRVEPVRYAEIAFTTSGVISEVLVEEGQPVKKGQTLIQLGGESDQTYAAAQLELTNAQQALNDLHNTSGTELAQVVIDLKDAQEEYDKAVDYLKYLQNSKKVPQSETRLFLETKRNSWMYVYKTKTFKGPAPEDWIIEAGNDLALKKAKWEELQHTYERMKDGVDTDQLAVLEARLNAAKAAVAALSVIAPFDGVLTDLNVKVGGSINAGEVAVTVADFSSWIVKTTDLTEIDVVELAKGQPVTITLDAIPDVPLMGKILSIGQNYSENQGDIVYEVTILLTDTHPAMRWGMTAEVKFEQ